MEFIQERQIIQLYNTSSASNMYDKVSLSHTSNTRNTSNARIQEIQIVKVFQIIQVIQVKITHLSLNFRVFTLCPHLQELRLQSQCWSAEVLAVQVVHSTSYITPIPVPTYLPPKYLRIKE